MVTLHPITKLAVVKIRNTTHLERPVHLTLTWECAPGTAEYQTTTLTLERGASLLILALRSSLIT